MVSDHKPRQVLLAELKEAARLVGVGQKYVHYKSPDKTYTVINIAITEVDDELCVIYQADYSPELVFVRPLSSWLEKVQYKGKAIDRFKTLT